MAALGAERCNAAACCTPHFRARTCGDGGWCCRMLGAAVCAAGTRRMELALNDGAQVAYGPSPDG